MGDYLRGSDLAHLPAEIIASYLENENTPDVRVIA
jgi:hypothetical protein